MALDSAAKRLSMMDLDSPFQAGITPPDGTWSAGDRFALMWLYSSLGTPGGGGGGESAVNTAAKRFSMMDLDSPFQPGITPPDGVMPAGDRKAFIWLYAQFDGGGAATLAMTDITHASLADHLTLHQTYTLTPTSAMHVALSDLLTLSGDAALIIQSGILPHVVDGIAVESNHFLSVEGALHAHTADVAGLSVQDILDVASGAHVHLADGSLALDSIHVLAVSDGLHAIVSTLIALTAESLLSIQSPLHNQTAQGLTLEQIAFLAGLGSSHAHQAQQPAFGQLHILTVSPALHAQIAGALNVEVGLMRPSFDRMFAIEAEDRTFVIVAEAVLH